MQTLTAIYTFINTHGAFDMGAMWVISVMISSLSAPTATSSGFYIWFFKFSNTIMGGITRAFGAKVEASPNFQAAVNIQQSAQGQPQTPIVPIPPAPSAEK